MKFTFPVIVDSVKKYTDKNNVEKTVFELREPYEEAPDFKGYRHKPSCIMQGIHWEFIPGRAYMAEAESFVFDGKESIRVQRIIPGELKEV